MNHQFTILLILSLIFSILSNSTSSTIFNLSNPAIAQTSNQKQHERDIMQRLNQLDDDGRTVALYKPLPLP